MSRRRVLAGAAAGLLTTVVAKAQTAASPRGGSGRPHLLPRLVPASTDFDEIMRTTRAFRVLAPPSPTLCMADRGRLHGTVPEGAQILEQWINRTWRTGSRPATVIVIPMPRAKLLPLLAEGRAEIAAGNLTVTEERARLVAFTKPLRTGVHEVIVTPEDTPEIDSPEALSGMTVITRRVSSHHDSLLRLNERLAAAGKPPVVIRLVSDDLENEDLLEMVSAKLIPAVVADDWMAAFWAPIFRKLRIHSKAALRTDAELAWAVRKDAPQLLATLNRLLDERRLNGGRQAAAEVAAIMSRLRQLHTATGEADARAFRATVELFRKYAGQYGFDHLMMVAQGYQESRLNQGARSHVGAIGMMQLMPATGREMRVGDIRQADANVHAGTKYMRRLLDVYFKDAELNEQDRHLFAFAAYNAGPGRIRQMRQLATQRGLDPNVWLENVELVTAERVGQEPVKYVRNIYKYYTAYKLLEETEAAAGAARDRVTQ